MWPELTLNQNSNSENARQKDQEFPFKVKKTYDAAVVVTANNDWWRGNNSYGKVSAYRSFTCQFSTSKKDVLVQVVPLQ